MSAPESLWGGIQAAVIGIVISIVLLLGFGLTTENLMISLENTNISSSGTIFDIAAPWDTGYDDASFWITILYIVCLSPAILGIIIMFVSAIKTQEYDVFTDEQESTYGNQAVPQRVTAEEIAFRRQM